MRRNLPERQLLLGQRSACERSAGSAQKRKDDAGVQYWERACELHRGLEHQGNVSALNAKKPCNIQGLPLSTAATCVPADCTAAGAQTNQGMKETGFLQR